MGQLRTEVLHDIMQEEQKASSTELSLEMELSVFAHAVIWQQAAPAPSPALAPPGSVGLAPSERGGPALTLVPDPEVGACAQNDGLVEANLQAKLFAGPCGDCRRFLPGQPEKQHVLLP